MYERPETPNSGSAEEKPRSETPGETSSLPEARYTPPSGGTADAPSSPGQPPAYNSAPAQDPYSWQPGQYTPPPAGQPTQYMPPQQGYAPNQYGQQQQPPQYPVPYQGGYPQHPPGYAPGQPQVGAKDPTIALLLELIGILGFLGIGHLYAGRTTRGVVMLVSWIIYDIFVILILPLVTIGSLATCGLGCIVFIPLIAIWLGVPIGSGLWIKNEMDRERAAMGMR